MPDLKSVRAALAAWLFSPRWRRPAFWRPLFLLLVLLGTGRFAFERWIATCPLPALSYATSPLMLDRQGHLLRAFPVADGRWRLTLDPAQLDPRYLDMLLAIEDRRFYRHHGVDLRALVRAALQWAVHGEIVSGGSTLTMQLARMLDGGSTRSLPGKLRQIRMAWAIERHLDKAQILRAYLERVPYGGNLEGVRAGSLAWFGKEPLHLNAAESAFLLALPQAPEARRPDRHPRTAQSARTRILQRACDAGLIDAHQLEAASRSPIPRQRRPFPMLAAHLTERLHQRNPAHAVMHLTLDAGIQRRLESLLAERVAGLGPQVSGAIVVASTLDGAILAEVGSADLFDVRRDGYVDMTRALRSPGSTLKPLIYGLAFEDGIAHPESLIEDRPRGFAGYVPTNFDHTFVGTVTVRQALQRSLNVPAVQLLDSVGPVRLLARLRRAGVRPVLPGQAAAGLAIGLGGLGVTLHDLVSLYAAIARGGMPVTLHEIAGESGIAGEPRTPVLDARSSWYVSSILSGVAPPLGFPYGRIAFKTGTSYGYRDAWSIGFDGRHVVGVWIGRPDAGSVPGLTGITAAAPLLFESFARLGEGEPLPPAPPGVLRVGTNALPLPLRRVRDPLRSSGRSEAPEIAYPPADAHIDLGLGRGQPMDLVLKVRGGTPPFTWLVDGVPVARAPFLRTTHWSPASAGYAKISVLDAHGSSSRVTVFLE